MGLRLGFVYRFLLRDSNLGSRVLSVDSFTSLPLHLGCSVGGLWAVPRELRPRQLRQAILTKFGYWVVAPGKDDQVSHPLSANKAEFNSIGWYGDTSRCPLHH